MPRKSVINIAMMTTTIARRTKKIVARFLHKEASVTIVKFFYVRELKIPRTRQFLGIRMISARACMRARANFSLLRLFLRESRRKKVITFNIKTRSGSNVS